MIFVVVSLLRACKTQFGEDLCYLKQQDVSLSQTKRRDRKKFSRGYTKYPYFRSFSGSTPNSQIGKIGRKLSLEFL